MTSRTPPVRTRPHEPQPQWGLGAALRDIAGAMLPLPLRELREQVDARLASVPIRVNEYGFDPYGFSPEVARESFFASALLHHYWFRVETHDIERVPAGRVMIVCNHAGQLPFDGAMLGTAMLLDAEPPRLCRPMGEYWIPRIPFFNVMAARTGAVVGTPENCAAMLREDEAVMVFPEGVRGMNKTFEQRYELQRFGTGFVRIALETGTPIVPVGLVGSEEQQPGIANLEGLGRALGMPAFPVTPTFPWLGPLGLWPLPVKYRFWFGEPLRFEGDPDEDDERIEARVAKVRDAIASLLRRGLAARTGVFL